MGVTNFDYLPQNIVQSRLIESRQTMIEQKGSLQLTTGNNLRYYVLDSGSEFAWTGTVSGYPTLIQPDFELTVTSKTAESFLVDVATELYTSSDGGTTWVRVADTNGYILPSVYQAESNGSSFIPNKSVWRIKIYGAALVGLKIQVLTTDEVTMSLARIS